MKASIPHIDLSKQTRKRWKPTKSFWNDELDKLWKEMHLADLKLKKSPNVYIKRINHRLYRTAQFSFDKKYRQTERIFKQ